MFTNVHAISPKWISFIGLLLINIVIAQDAAQASLSPCPAGSCYQYLPMIRQAELAATATVAVDLGTVNNSNARKLLGVSFDGRTNFLLPTNQGLVLAGYYDTQGSMLPGIAPLWQRVPLTTLRYPGNAVNQLSWKDTVGPNRPAVSLTGGPAQVVTFGFDEFMAMTAARGVSPTDIQIMINLYATATEPDPVQSAADWVEYANAPNDGSNPGGGVDWAAKRASHGHPLPYGIQIWNLGNEPWGPTEYNFNVDQYWPLAQQFILAMKAIDPTIKITLPAAGAPVMNTPGGAQRRALMTQWDTTLLNKLGDQIYGLSQHLFYDESTIRGVAAAQGAVNLLSQQIIASGKNVRLLIGDHAHAIPQLPNNGGPAIPPDYAMQWQGALTTADFLMMSSENPLIDRANFWIYGMPLAQWHPIRRNADASYTFMPVAAIYEMLDTVILDQALAVTTTSPASTDGNTNSIRAGAFRSPDHSSVSVVLINRDTAVDHIVSLAGLENYQLVSARRLSATGQAADDFTVSSLILPANETIFTVPGLTILLLEFQQAISQKSAPT